MNHINMTGLNATNGVVGGMPQMTNGINGVGSRAGSDQDTQNDYEAKLNTYIYDYFLKHEQYDCARAILQSGAAVHVSQKRRDGDVNGVDDGAMDTDSKDEIDSKRPNDLPPPEVVGPENASFLLEWFSLFWDVFLAQRKAPGASKQAMQYMQHTQVSQVHSDEGRPDQADIDFQWFQQQLKMRQEQQQQYLRQPQFAGGMNQYNMMRMQNGMPDMRQRALQNNNRNITPQQMQMARNQQQLMQQQQMSRDGSDVDINGQRPRTPSSGDGAPSPSKRPRLAGPQFNGQQMMPNGRVPPQGLQAQPMMNPIAAQANSLLMQHGINPEFLSQTQLESFQQQNPQVQKKSIQVYAQNMAQQHRQSMPQQTGMPNGGSPMMQPGMDVGSGMPDFYGTNPQAMRMGSVQAPNGAGGNHALQDYQMQLMLLEQQNKKRLLMARQEQESLRPDGTPAMPAGFPPGMSPQGSRSGPSPNPSDQMKRGTPKMGQVGLPGSGSPMPDGSMPQNRGSPAAMTFNPMAPEIFQHMKMGNGMGDPNGNGMRPPSSHPQFGGQYSQQQMEAMARAPNGNGRMPNGTWPQGPQGQAPMIPQPNAQQPQMGTPQSRNAMPPPQAPPTATTNGRPSSPTQGAAPPTPSQTNKGNPKGKKDDKGPRKRPAKKGSTATIGTGATPASDGDNPPPTPTPSTPITPHHPSSFNQPKNANGQTANAQAVTSAPATAGPIQPPQPDMGMGQFVPVENMDHGSLDMTFGGLNDDVLDQFDFDSFLQDSGGHDELSFDPSMAFGTIDGVEAGAGDS